MRWLVLLAVAVVLSACADEAGTDARVVSSDDDVRMNPGTRPSRGPGQPPAPGGPGGPPEPDVAAVPEPPATASVALGAPVAWQDTCPCAQRAFIVEPPVSAAGRSWFEVRVTWDGTVVQPAQALLTGPDGTSVPLERGFDALRIQVFDASAGLYGLSMSGEGAFDGVARLVDLDAPRPAELLPNLVTLIPVHPEIGSCHVEERIEQGASRCLRVGNAVGNTGDGPLEVRLSPLDGVLAVGGLGTFMQRISQSDGGHRDVAVGGAQFHAVHGHYHYQGLAQFSLFAMEGGVRAGEAAAGSKAGFCFLDWGEMVERDMDRGSGGRAAQDCLLPGTQGWSMGVSVGWYDYYWSGLAEQYIDVLDVADGLYELVAVADPLGTLHETDESDNAASLVIELRDGTVTVLEERGFYRNPDP